MNVSIIIPCYNEESLIETVLDRVVQASLPFGVSREIIVVNDGSTDDTGARLHQYQADHGEMQIRIITHSQNQGKGASIRSALAVLTGDLVLIQDADLEYDPRDYPLLLEPVLEGHADVVYGSRFMGTGPHRVLFYFHTIGNNFLTFLSNLFTQVNLTDMETGYKLFRSEHLKSIRLVENRFGFEPEVTAKISRIPRIRIYEIGIRYYGRTYSDGKKINWKDGFHALYCIVKYNIFSRK